jgi:hypothetical protein
MEPGAGPDSRPPTSVTQGGVTIQGDPNVPGDILPQFDFNVNVSGVTLLNLRLGTVTIAAGVNTTTIKRCLVNDVTETGGASGNGGNTITQDRILDSVQLIGNSGTTATNDVVTFNAFTGASPSTMLDVRSDSGVLIQSNTFVGDTAGQIGIFMADCGTPAAPAVIANNTVNCFSAQGGVIVDQLNTSTFARVLNNTITTNGHGPGLLLDPVVQSGDTVLVQGNDLTGNAIGLKYAGNSTTPMPADLGGGALGSLGGNNFRTYTLTGTTTAAAILLTNVASGTTLQARNNLFGDSVNPAVVVDDSVHGAHTGAGTLDLGTTLSAGRTFVQSLYNDLLGRTGALAELDGWVALLNAQGQAAVVNGVLRSREALGRIVDGFYLQFLGRQSDAGREGWINLLQSGVSEETVEADFLSSPEFLSHIDTDFVQSLYLLILHRTGSAPELAAWNSALPTLGLFGVAAGFTNSVENRSNAVTGFITGFLHRSPAPGEVASVVALPADLLSIEAGILGSTEFFLKG